MFYARVVALFLARYQTLEVCDAFPQQVAWICRGAGNRQLSTTLQSLDGLLLTAKLSALHRVGIPLATRLSSKSKIRILAVRTPSLL